MSAPAPPRVSRARAAGWWMLDYAAAARRQLALFGAARPPRHWLHGDPALPELVLLPGVLEHWTFLRPLGERLHRAGHRVRVVHGLGANARPIPETAERLARALRRRPPPEAGRILVGHSKGGLIGKRLLVAEAAAPGSAGGLLGVVAVATPFGGARRARWLRAASIREFLPANTVLRELAAARHVDARIVTVSGRYDPHVPEGTALPGATDLRVAAAGHFRLLDSPETARAVLEGVARLAAAARHP